MALILEDDAILAPNFSEKLNEYLNKRPNDFEAGFLNDGCGFHAKNVTPDKVWYLEMASRTCCSYVITQSACKKLVENMIPFETVIDHELNNQFLKLDIKAYWAEPTIVTDGSVTVYSSSYIRFNDLYG